MTARAAGRAFAVQLRGALLSVTAVVGLVSLLAVAGGLLFGVRPLVVVSGSMEPTIPVGSLILSRTVDAGAVVVGDVVTVPRRTGSQLVTHRVVAVAEAPGGTRELTLRGDANDSDDPYTYTVAAVRRLVVTLPRAGYVASWLRTRAGVLTVGGMVLTVAGLYLLGPQAPRHRVSRPPSPRSRRPARTGRPAPPR